MEKRESRLFLFFFVWGFVFWHWTWRHQKLKSLIESGNNNKQPPKNDTKKTKKEMFFFFYYSMYQELSHPSGSAPKLFYWNVVEINPKARGGGGGE